MRYEQVQLELREHLLRLVRRHPEGGLPLSNEKTLSEQFGVSERMIREAMGVMAHDGLVIRRHGSGTYLQPARKFQHVALLMQPMIGCQWPNAEMFRYHALRFALQQLVAEGHECQMYWPAHMQSRDQLDQTMPPFECPALARAVHRGQISGIIGLNVHPDGAWHHRAQQMNIPMAGSYGEFQNVVGGASQQAVRDGVRMLVEHGARRIGLLAWTDSKGIRKPSWSEPLKQALAEYSLQYNSRWVITDHWPLLRSAGWEGFREIWSAGREKPDGLMICDDFLYTDAVQAIEELNIAVPDQLKLVTTANLGVPLHCPVPTGVLMLDTSRYGHRLARLLMRQMAHPDEPPVTETVSYTPLPGLHRGAIVSGELSELQRSTVPLMNRSKPDMEGVR